MSELNVSHVHVAFGGMPILKGISLDVAPGEVVGIIGPNGCGKTTFLNTLSGFVHQIKGTIKVGGENIEDLEAWRRARKYFGRSFQNTGVFTHMTLEENLMLVLEKEEGFPWWWMLSKKYKDQMKEKVLEALREVGLEHHRTSLAGILSGGQLRLLELMKLKLLKRPILLIDEPTAGVAPVLRNQLAATITKLAKESGHTVLIVEHDLKFLFSIVDRVIVFVDGEIYMEGKPEEVQKDERLREVYFGK